MPASTMPESPNLDMMSKTLASVQDQIKFADTKATFTAGLNVLLFGFLAPSVDKLTTVPAGARAWAFHVAAILLILYAVFALASMILVMMTVVSRFGDLAPKSRTHFGHVLTNYGKDYAKYCKEVAAMSVCDWAEDVGGQIVETSHIAQTKHWYARRAAIGTLVAMLLWAASLVAVLAAH